VHPVLAYDFGIIVGTIFGILLYKAWCWADKIQVEENQPLDATEWWQNVKTVLK
jgi:hypothetical protein